MNTIKLKQAFGLALQSLNQLLWPPLNCKQNISESDRNLCRNCWDQLLSCTGSDYCPSCGKDANRLALLDGACPDCQGKDFYFDQIARSGLYTQALQQIILKFKNGKTELDTILTLLINPALQGSCFYNDIELFVPVPLHFRRRLSRGYNQSYLLAKKLQHPIAKINTDLVRIRHTKQQPMMISPTKRRKNVAGAFAVRLGHKFTGRNICLIDDIKTTGATLNECAKVLKQAGAKKVYALVLAAAGQNIS